eukprot:Phypoly_transcript_00249.p1 GENE.Phypoly_transcript_00249~~Phypoly_transcript_00249.p1  ORF type:complete len:1686 (+),score=203.02 Phypoly_transcript_00249:580-5637(+)
MYFYLATTTGPRLKNAASMGNFPFALFSGDAASITIGPFKNQGTNQRFVFTKLDEGDLLFVMRPNWPADPTSHPYEYYTQAAGIYHVDYLWHLQPEGANISFVIGSGGWGAEIAIPWTVLGYSATDGDSIPFDIEIIVGDPSGSIIVDAGWWFSRGPATATEDIVGQATLYPYFWGNAHLQTNNVGGQTAVVVIPDPVYVPRGVPVNLQITDDTRANTVNVIHKTGTWVYRELIRAKKLAIGNYTIYWDGYDREGKIVPAGDYRIVVADFPPLTANFMGSAGNSATPPYGTDDGLGSYGGQHFGPDCVAGDSTGVYILHGYEEGRGGLRRIDPKTGKAIWVGVFGGGMATTLATNYAGMICASGYQGTYGYNDMYILCWNTTNGGALNNYHNMPPAATGVNANSMAIFNQTLYMAWSGILLVAQAHGYQSWTSFNRSVPELRSLCRFDPNSLLFVYNGALALYDINTLSLKWWVNDTARMNNSLVCTRYMDSGNVYISNQTHVVSYSADGKFVRTFGKGLRPFTVDPYDPYQMRDVQYLAVGPDANLYICERGSTAPLRFGVFNANSGAWVRDYYGPIAYQTVIPDIDDNEYVYYVIGSDYPALVKAKVNYTAYALDNTDSYHGFQVAAIYCFSQNGVDLSVPIEQDLVRNSDWAISATGYAGGKVFTAANGMKYLFIAGQRRSCFMYLAFDPIKKIWKPKTAVNWISRNSWQDLDGDGLVNSTLEMFKTATSNAFSFTDTDRDFNVYGARHRMSAREVDANGVPRFDGNLTIYDYFSGNTMPWGSYWQAFTSNYAIFSSPSTSEPNTSYAAQNTGIGGFQSYWDRAAMAKFVKMKNGKVEWVVGNRNIAQGNGDITYLEPMAGEVDGVVCCADVMSNFVCYSSEGFALGYMVGTASNGPIEIQVENAGQATFYKAPDGKRVLATMTTGDTRILEMTGPFGDVFNRKYIDVTLPDPEWRVYDGPNPQKKVYDLQYITEGDGKDGRFYNYAPHADGFDYEWTSHVPSQRLRDPDTGKVIAEVRFRRDAGELNVFIDVVYPSEDLYPYFPYNTDSAAQDVNTTMFGHAAGFEIMLGPTPSARTNAMAGDTRVFLTGIAKAGNNPYTGYALAVRPGTSPIVNSSYFSDLDRTGTFTSTVRKTVDFSKLSVIPGADVGIMARLDGLGYKLEASIPLALFPEICSVQNVTYRRYYTSSGIGSTPAFYTSQRYDFNKNLVPYAFNFALYMTLNGVTKRIPWQQDGFTGTDPTKMNPSMWGVISPPATTVAYASTPSQETFNYSSTTTATIDYHLPPTYTPTSDSLVVATFFSTLSTPFRFFNKSFVNGFSIANGPGQTGFQTVVVNNPSIRNIPFVDLTDVGIVDLPKEKSGASQNNGSHTMYVDTAFATEVSGIMHVLWGDWASNSQWGGYLIVKERATGKVISGLDPNYGSMYFKPTYYQGNRQARVTTFVVGGKSTYEVTVNATLPHDPIWIEAIWVTPSSTPSYHAPASVTFIAENLLGNTVNVDDFYFYVGDDLVAQTTDGAPVEWNNVNAGTYQVQPVGVDKFSGQSNASAITITVYGPYVVPISPANNSQVSNPVTLQFLVSQVGAAHGTKLTVSVGGATYTINQDPWTVILGDIPDGRVSVGVYAVDDAGDFSQFTYSFTVYTPPPTPAPTLSPPTFSPIKSSAHVTLPLVALFCTMMCFLIL